MGGSQSSISEYSIPVEEKSDDELSTLVTTLSMLPTLEPLLPRMKHLKTIIFADSESEVPDLELQLFKSRLMGKAVVLWKDVMAAGDCANRLPSGGQNLMDSVHTICYTSGTTGIPKGVIYSQRAMIANVAAIIRGPFQKTVDVTSGDVHMSYLPLAHILERTICNALLSRGGSIGFYSGDVLKLLDDIQTLRPTVFISVPRLFCRINDKVTIGIAQKSALVQFLFNRGMQTKLEALRQDGALVHKLWDKLVFNKTKNLLGGRVRFMVSGGAPLDAAVEERVKVLFCAPLLQGYGLTETLGAALLSDPADNVVGHVGGPLPWCEFRLESIEEMKYNFNDNPPAGELILRGPSMFKGYFRSPELTSEVVDSKGWFHTGDVAVLLPTGALKLVDRRKNIFKLAQGEYVAPEKIEMVYAQSNLVSQIFVFGYSTKNFLVAIVVPDAEAISGEWGGKPLALLCENPKFREAVEKDMDRVADRNKLKGFEKVRSIRLTAEPFTPENGLLTPTMKLRRSIAKDHFCSLIDEMYSDSETAGVS